MILQVFKGSCQKSKFICCFGSKWQKLRWCSSLVGGSGENEESVDQKLLRDDRDLGKWTNDKIRNFSIIAHVDHGKSTLADRLLEFTGSISLTQHDSQILDKLPVERQRGITVKAQTASMIYRHKGINYLLNLIDTPGHVDFNAEVARSLRACQGVILLVDANQGVQAQTLANFYLAFAGNLVILPVINKIDLKNAQVENVSSQMENLFEIKTQDIHKISAKLGVGIEGMLGAVIEKIPPPMACDRKSSLRAFVFDCWYNQYKGAICLVIVMDGVISTKDTIISSHTGKSFEVRELGILCPEEVKVDKLYAGQVGYIVANIRSLKEAIIGDTFTIKGCKITPLEMFKEVKPMVYAGLYPVNQSEMQEFKRSLEKLLLNDASVSVQMENSAALGLGWRLGFLGLLHMEVFTQRLEQEFKAQLIVTTPSVPYKAKLKSQKLIKLHKRDEILIRSVHDFPTKEEVVDYFEPLVLGTIIIPSEFYGSVISLCLERRGEEVKTTYIGKQRILLVFKFPLSEIAIDFFDKLKSLTSGYGSFDYEDYGYQPAKLEKLDIYLNGVMVPELSTIVHSSRSRVFARSITTRLQEAIPQQLVMIAIQAKINSSVIARENIKALRKDVTMKLKSGGDINRRRKLLHQQKEGKEKMRKLYNIDIPRDIFIKVLKR